MSDIDPAAITTLLPNLSEDGAFVVFYAMCQQYGWSGTFFTKGDAEQAWNNYREDQAEEFSADEDIPEDIWDKIQNSWAWRRGMSERLAEMGWDMVHEAVREVMNDE